MNKRITCIALFESNDLIALEKFISVVGPTNKVPFSIENRSEVDRLPRHSTLIVWQNQNKEKIIKLMKSLSVKPMELEVTAISLKKSLDKSYNLFFEVKWDDNLKKLKQEIYHQLPSEKYHPDQYQTHITIHTDDDYVKIMTMKKRLEINFRPFKLKVSEIGIFDIYPTNELYRIII